MDLYSDLGSVMGALEADADEISMMVLNGSNDAANRYLKEAEGNVRRALVHLSDALFEITTTPMDTSDDDDDEF